MFSNSAVCCISGKCASLVQISAAGAGAELLLKPFAMAATGTKGKLLRVIDDMEIIAK